MKRVTLSTASLLFAVALATAPLSAQPQPGTLLGSTGAAGASLVDIDPTTGQSGFLASLGQFGPVTEIVFREDGVLFGSTGGGASNFIRIDPATGVETLVGQHPSGAINGMEFVGGDLYGAFFQSQGGKSAEGLGATLVIIDQQTGQLSEIGPIDAFIIRGLAYDPVSDTLYGAGVAPNESEAFFVIDRNTGAATPISSMSPAAGGIRFGPDGILYGGEAVQAGPTANGTNGAALFSIDPATGATSLIGDTGLAALSGLAFAPPANASIIEVPTLSALGLLVIATLLFAAALMAIRRRRAEGSV